MPNPSPNPGPTVRVPVADLRTGQRATVTGTDQYGSATTVTGYVTAPSRFTHRRRGDILGVLLSEFPDGMAGWRASVFCTLDATADLLNTTAAAPAVERSRTGNPLTRLARKVEGYVTTPPELVDALCRYPYANLGALPPGSWVLEPSAGHGAIVAGILAANPGVNVMAVEPRVDRALEIAVPAGRTVVLATTTFEEFAADPPHLFDAVVMNPPFAVHGNRTLWIDHLHLAWKLLAPGGRLAAIVAGGLTFRQDRKHNAIRDLVEDHGEATELPDDAFKSEGVSMGTVMLTMEKPILSDDALEDDDEPAPRRLAHPEGQSTLFDDFPALAELLP